MLRRELKYAGRFQQQHYNSVALAEARRPGVLASKRVRGVQRNEKLPFVPPEDWHEPTESPKGYRIIVQDPGKGCRHILSPADIRARLAQFPDDMLANLDVVQLSRITRKKQSFPCYGMQWGSSLYLYPIEESLVEYYHCPPTPNQINEARMYGGRWSQESKYVWKLEWTEESVRDFYLNNILIHELGHLVDSRNTGYVARERYAEWFALEYGYKPSRTAARAEKLSAAITRTAPCGLLRRAIGIGGSVRGCRTLARSRGDSYNISRSGLVGHCRDARELLAEIALHANSAN